MTFTATPEAVDALKQAIAQVSTQPETSDVPSAVRVYVASQCGCGNAHFQMGLDEPEADDEQIDVGGVTILVDPNSAPALEGARLEVVHSENLLTPQFHIATANTGGCGCGGHHGHHHH